MNPLIKKREEARARARNLAIRAWVARRIEYYTLLAGDRLAARVASRVAKHFDALCDAACKVAASIRVRVTRKKR